MKKSAILSLTALALLLATAWSGQAAPYFPYDTIDKYYGIQPQEQPDSNQPQAGQAPAGQHPPVSPQPVEPPVLAPPEPRGPVAVKAPPEFLFPAKLGFGVAVGVPYDMMYISESYYQWQGGTWYRSPSYRGPWTSLGESQLPPELHKYSLAKIRELRNSEFITYWKNKDEYKGRRFRPGGELKEKRPN